MIRQRRFSLFPVSAMALVLFIAPVSASPAHAQVQPRAEAASETSCSLDALIGTLRSIQTKLKDKLSENDAKQLRAEELSARKSLMKETIGCALKTMRELRDAVHELQLLGDEDKTLQAQFAGDLDGAIEYHETLLASIDARGGEEIKSAAAEFRSRREGVYIPLAERVGHFIFWTQNQDLIEKAKTRLSQTRQTIAFLKVAQNDDVQTAFEQVRTFLFRSEEAHFRAQQSFTRKEPPATSLGYIKTSLGELYHAYNAFFELSMAVQHALSRK